MVSRYRKRSAMKKPEVFIFQQPDKQNLDENKFYAFSDNHDFIDEENNYRSNSENSEKTLAKILHRQDDTKKFMIRVDYTYKPYNPISVYGDRVAYRGKDQTRPTSKFINVNQNAFNMYLKFLTTKNISWLHNTEREM